MAAHHEPPLTRSTLIEVLDEVLDAKLEQKLEEKLEQKLEQKFEEKLAPIRTDISELKTSVHGLEVLYEDLDERFRADSQFLHESLQLTDTVKDHDGRLTSIESTQALLVATVTEHSKKLSAA